MTSATGQPAGAQEVDSTVGPWVEDGRFEHLHLHPRPAHDPPQLAVSDDALRTLNPEEPVRAWYFNDDFWQGLCQEQQEILTTEMEAVGEEVTTTTRQRIDEAMDVIKQNMTVVDVDVEAFRDALDGEFNQYEGDLWPEGTLDTVRSLAEKYADAG